MGIIGKDFKYKKIENFLSKEEIELLNLYCEIRHRVNPKHFFEDGISIPNSSFYGIFNVKEKNFNGKRNRKKTFSYL
jgi:hypothetical protein